MVESSDLRELNDPAEFRRLHVSGLRRILAERKMRAGNVVIAKVVAQDFQQVAFIEDDYVIEAFSTDGTDDPFDIWILPRGTWCNENLLDAKAGPLTSSRPGALRLRP